MGLATDPTLDAVQRRIVDDLRRDGIALFRYEELFAEPPLSELQRNIATFVGEAQEDVREHGPAPATKHDFIVRRFLRQDDGAPKPVFALDSPWLRVGAAPAVLDVVTAYRGEPVRMHYMDNWYTVPYEGQDTRIASQRWHRDPEETNVVKMFLYLSEVDEGAGPFEYAKGTFGGGRYEGFYPHDAGELHPPERELRATVAPEDIVAITGSPGSMFLCDTGGFHRGGFARTAPRILATWSYVSFGHPQEHRFEVDFGGREAELPAQVRAALV